MPNYFMGRFYKMVNQKVNLGRRPMPTRLPADTDIAILKDGFF